MKIPINITALVSWAKNVTILHSGKAVMKARHLLLGLDKKSHSLPHHPEGYSV
jgi:hypothetical protein